MPDLLIRDARPDDQDAIRDVTLAANHEYAAWPEVRLLAVAPSARGRGLGAALMRECVRRARQSGAGEGYRISSVPAASRTSADATRQNIKVSDRFHPEGHELVIDVLEPDRLLVPTSTSLAGPVEAPDPGDHDVDHLKCYAVQVSPGAEKFRAITGVAVHDEFTPRPERRTLQRPTRLCTPASKNDEGTKSEANHLMCYRALLPFGLPRLRLIFGIFASNQFGSGQLNTLTESELCVSATIRSP